MPAPLSHRIAERVRDAGYPIEGEVVEKARVVPK